MGRRMALCLGIWCLVLVSGVFAAPDPLRICADPDNLPFTSADARLPGMYRELAEALAKYLGSHTAYVWWRNFQGGRSIRLTLLAGKCDLYFGLPAVKGFMGNRVLLSRPFLTAGYALVVPKALSIHNLRDLYGKRVGVQFSSPPQHLLAPRETITTATFLYPEEAMEALHAGEIDLAFIWGPTAGYLNKYRFQEAYKVIPVAAPDMQWPVAIGLRKTETALKTELDRALVTLRKTIGRLATKYGFPHREPQSLLEQRKGQTASPPRHAELAAGNHVHNPFRGDATAIREGRSLLNQYCAHCHGPNAVSAERRTNLRRLHKRYPGTHDQVFFTTVTNGRPAKGMPPWGGVLQVEQLWKIKAFLDSIQTD